MSFESAIQVRIQPSVIKWYDELSCKEIGKVKKWKQILKKIFVKLTQLACANPAVQKKEWQADLEHAGKETIVIVCPDWQTDPAHQATYECILKEMYPKRSPRRDWLQETACTWLESLPGEFQNAGWYPDEAIRIAHQVFLRGSTKFPAFIKTLRKRKSPIILRLIKAWEATPGRPCMAFVSIIKSYVFLYMRLSVRELVT